MYFPPNWEFGSALSKLNFGEGGGGLNTPTPLGTPLSKFVIMLGMQYGSGVDSASNRNEYQEYFLGVKAAGA
jgi:hypothetical protein